MAFISVHLEDGRDINLDVSGCETFADVKAIIRNQFGVLYAFEFSQLPASRVLGDSEKVESVMKASCDFKTHLFYMTHVNVKVNIRIITGEQPVVKDIDLFRVESVNHLKRKLREDMKWDEDFHFQVFWLNGHIWEALGRDATLRGGAMKLPWQLYCGNHTLEVRPVIPQLDTAVCTLDDFIRYYETCNDLGEVQYQHSKMCEALTMLSIRINRLQGGSQFDQLAPFTNHTDGSRRLSSMMRECGDKEIYKVCFEEELAHIQSGVGMYQIDLVEEAKQKNLLIIHSSSSSDEESSSLNPTDGNGYGDEVPLGNAQASGDVEPEEENEPKGVILSLTITDKRYENTRVHEITFDTNKSMAKLRDIIVTDVLNLPISHSKKLTFTRKRNDEVLSNFRLRAKSMLIDNDEIVVGLRVRGGGVRQSQKKTTATAKAKAVKMETKSNEKIYLLEEIGKTIPVEFANIPAVVNTVSNVRTFIETMNAIGATSAFTRLFQGLRASNPQVFKDTLNYLKVSGSNNPSTKLNYIATGIFGGIALTDMSEHLDKIANTPKIAMNAVYEKAVSQDKSFTMGDVIKIMETTDALFVANAQASTAPALAEATERLDISL